MAAFAINASATLPWCFAVAIIGEPERVHRIADGERLQPSAIVVSPLPRQPVTQRGLEQSHGAVLRVGQQILIPPRTGKLAVKACNRAAES
jgi:hypothetical protein